MTPSVEVNTAVRARVSFVLLPSTTMLCPPLKRLKMMDDETAIADPPATNVCEPRTYVGVASDPVGLAWGMLSAKELLMITAPPDCGIEYVVPETTAGGDPGVIVWPPTTKDTGDTVCGSEIDCVVESFITTVSPEAGTENVVPEITVAGSPGVIVWVPATNDTSVVVRAGFVGSDELLGPTWTGVGVGKESGSSGLVEPCFGGEFVDGAGSFDGDGSVAGLKLREDAGDGSAAGLELDDGDGVSTGGGLFPVDERSACGSWPADEDGSGVGSGSGEVVGDGVGALGVVCGW
jgi:hypothetical protein